MQQETTCKKQKERGWGEGEEEKGERFEKQKTERMWWIREILSARRGSCQEPRGEQSVLWPQGERLTGPAGNWETRKQEDQHWRWAPRPPAQDHVPLSPSPLSIQCMLRGCAQPAQPAWHTHSPLVFSPEGQGGSVFANLASSFLLVCLTKNRSCARSLK